MLRLLRLLKPSSEPWVWTTSLRQQQKLLDLRLYSTQRSMHFFSRSFTAIIFLNYTIALIRTILHDELTVAHALTT